MIDRAARWLLSWLIRHEMRRQIREEQAWLDDRCPDSVTDVSERE